MASSVASRPGFLRWLVTAGDPATLVATFTTAAGSPVDLSGSTIAAACANWSTSHAGTATVGGASNNEVTVAFADAVTGQLSGRGWTWTLTVDGVTTLAGPLDVAQPGVAGVVGGDASAVVVVDDVRVAVTVTTAGGGGGGGGAVDSVNGQTGVVVLAAADVGADPAGTAAGLVDDLSGVSNAATARSNLGLGTAAVADTGTGAANVILGSDTRLTDARTPTAHSHAGSDITSGIVPPAVLGTGGAGGGAKFLADDSTFKAPPSLGAVLGDVKMTSAQASVSFTSIPNTYASLVVVYQVRGDTAGVSNTGIRVTFNNDSGSNYNGQFVGGNNTTAYAAIQTAAAFGYLGEMPAATATSGYSSSGTIEIPNYMGTAFFKNAMFATTRDTNGAGANMVAYRGHIVWKSTTAISRIDLFPQYGNFLTGSRVTLYGIVGA